MFNSLKYKLWRRRLSVSSARMAITTQRPWPLRAVFLAVVVGAGGAIAMWTYDLGRGWTAPKAGDARRQLAEYQEQVEMLTEERDRFSTTVNSAESQLNIERSAQKQLAAQVKALELENTRLKEDLAFFESLLPNGTGPQGVAIRRLKIDLIAPNQLRYRLLIMQGGKGDQDFSGNLQLVVTTLQGGKNAMMNFPEGNSNELDKFKLGFRHYQRVEGILTLPDGATVRLVQARVLEKGQIRAQQSANL
ncbi:hypothetical protein D3870_15215 [Noviherbaspirillum cavernae]|uniref:Uncharacterized protein n=1 Tax=Noviherbaspirillum cavernae TaxID=2320862 RepID=A0A418X3Y4_9BURK|nr:DUF6776 family protein [Noviherbaspirillum cavernae]RJG07172.1 hypothetical protein D3870_15215 [Noviherbaspirillum cavernae]